MTREEIKEQYQEEAQRRLDRNLDLACQGVKFIDINQAYISEETKIGPGTVIYPMVVLEGKVTIGANCTIGQNSRLVDSTIGDGTTIQNSVVLESTVGNNTSVGPFAYLRPGCKVGDNCKVGDFVEVKNSSMGDGSKASHLSYIGDSHVGKDVNIGCGVVFVNYDGKNKHMSTIGDGAFIGCNTNLISPVNVGEKAYIAAGSTVTVNVPKGGLFVARAKGKFIDGWVERRGLLNKSKKTEE